MIEKVIEKISNLKWYCGCDEAGAGCCAGDLVVAAVILDPNNPIIGLRDSKKLSEKKREILYDQIIKKSLDYTIIYISPSEVDDLNIFNARMLGMKKAIESLKKVDYAIIDGNKIPKDLTVEADWVIKGDDKFDCVSAASILAKVSRDRKIKEQSLLFPEYKFEVHKGYVTKIHLEMLEKYGACEIHRKSYKPVKNNLKK